MQRRVRGHRVEQTLEQKCQPQMQLARKRVKNHTRREGGGGGRTPDYLRI